MSNKPPALSNDQRMAALDKAKVARETRAKIREDVKAGKLTVKQVLDMRSTDEFVARMKVSALIEALPGYGKAKTEKVMAELKIAESRRLKGLGERQEAELINRLG